MTQIAASLPLGQVDLDTGEDLGGFIAVIRSKQKSAFERHFTMNQSALLSIANDLNHDQTRVLMVLLADRDYENYIYISQVEMAEEFNVQKNM